MPTLIRKQTCAAYARDDGLHLLGFFFSNYLTNEADMRGWQEDIIFLTQQEASSNKLQQGEGMRVGGWRIICLLINLLL